MVTIYNRTRETKPAKRMEAGNEVDCQKRTSDVCIVGRVLTITDSTVSSGVNAGHNKTTITLANGAIDPDLGVPVNGEPITIVFIDRTGGKFGDQLAATKLRKMNVQPGTLIMIKCSKSETLDMQGNVIETSYFGQRVAYTGTTFQYKTNDYGPGAYLTFGVACPNEKTGKIHVPVNENLGPNWGTVWVEFAQDETGAVSKDLYDKLSQPTEDGHKQVVVFSSSFNNYHLVENDQKIIVSGNAVFDEVFIINEPAAVGAQTVES